MRKFMKIAALYAASFLIVFTINGALSIDTEHGFFYLTPAKLAIRLTVALLITAQIYIKFTKKFE